MLKTFLIKIINIAANKSEIIGVKEVESRSDCKLFLKSVKKNTPFTNKLDTIPSEHPTLSPIKSNEKRSINRFFILMVIDLPCNNFYISIFN